MTAKAAKNREEAFVAALVGLVGSYEKLSDGKDVEWRLALAQRLAQLDPPKLHELTKMMIEADVMKRCVRNEVDIKLGP